MALFARVTTYPPLGQVTVVPPSRKQFNFTVVIESSQSFPDRPWEVSIWYDHGSYSHTTAPWKNLDLQKVAFAPTVLYDNRNTSVYRYTFEGNLPSPFPNNGKTYKGRKIPFTVRYRIDSNSEWQWVADNFGVGDGAVILQPPVDPNFLGAGPVELMEGWYARKLNSEAPGARLYIVESSIAIPANPEGESVEICKSLGYILSPCRWFALVRIWQPWLAPRHGNEFLRLDKPALMLSFLRADGQHVVLLAVNGVDDCLTTFSSDEQGHIVCCAKNDTGKEKKLRILAAMAWSFEIANCAVMYEMRKMVYQSSAYSEALQSLSDLNLDLKDVPAETMPNTVSSNGVSRSRKNSSKELAPKPQWQQGWYDYLSYCTWNSLGQDLNIDKIMSGLQSLAESGIDVTTLIIDDNWQSLTGTQGQTSQFERGWTNFEANAEGFPEGLKGAVDRIKKAHPKIRDIAVWHALFGYWGCVSPEKGHIKEDYKIREVTIHHQNWGYVKRHVVDPIDIHKMYNDFYTFLSDSGITSVKTDAQFFLDLLSDSKDRQEMTVPYQSAWTQAYLRHLGGKAISCMSQVPQILFHSFLPMTTPQIVLRNSDDFFPEIDKSHPWHVFANAHSACLVQHLNVLPDWDMFQTSHPWSGFHAAARCLSGGPVYITDTPGQHDVDLIHQMTAKNPRGETVILRPSNIGKTLGVYDSYEEGSILKIGTYDGRGEIGTGMIGVFNIHEAERAFIMPVSKFPGVEAVEVEEGSERRGSEFIGQRKWVIRSHVTGNITTAIAPTIPPRGDALLECTLPQRGYDIWSAIPVHGPFQLPSSKPEFATIGLMGKMTGACAIIQSSFSYSNDKSAVRVQVQLKALGKLGIWVSDGANRDIGHLMVLIHGKAVPVEKVNIKKQGCASKEAAVLEIDVEKAWEEMKLDGGWGNEVGVEVFFS